MLQQKMKSKSRALRLALGTTISLFILNTTGFIDTLTNSTMACGKHWPLCNGSLIPMTLDIHTWIEYGHRLLVLSITLMLLSLAVVAWRKHGAVRKVRIMIILAFLGVIIESFLGALSIFYVSPPALMAAHMGVALLSFGSVIVLTVMISHLENPKKIKQVAISKRVSYLIWFTLGYLYLAIYFGAFVSSTGTGGSFQGYPIPTEPYSKALMIDIAHRSIGFCLLVLIVSIAVLTNRTRKQRRDLFNGSIWAVFLVILQGLSGALLIYTHLSLLSVMIHVSIVSILFGVMCYLSTRCALNTNKVVVPKQMLVNQKANQFARSASLL